MLKLELSEAWTFVMPAAIATVVTVAEILKNNGFAVEKSETSYFPVLSSPFTLWFLINI